MQQLIAIRLMGFIVINQYISVYIFLKWHLCRCPKPNATCKSMIENCRTKKASIALAGFSLFGTQAMQGGEKVGQIIFTIDAP